MKYLVCILTLLSCFLEREAFGHHGGTGIGPGKAGPITTIPATTLPEGHFVVDFRLENLRFDRYSDGELLDFAMQENEVHSVDSRWSTILTGAYGVTNDLLVGLRLPYVSHEQIKEGHEHMGEVEVHRHGDSADFGDLTLFGQYRLLHRHSKELEVSVLFGLKMPTGRTTESTRQGPRFEVEHQPGSGSWDPMTGLAVTKRWGRLSLDGNILYTFTTRGNQRTTLGDIFFYNLAASYRIGEIREVHHYKVGDQVHEKEHTHLAWDLVGELNGEWNGKHETSDRDDDNSGGNQVYFSPGVRATIADRYSPFLSVGIPILQDMNGKEQESDYRFTVGMSVGF
ncbi:MAG: transporter [Candidatus Brocadiales bacterium]